MYVCIYPKYLPAVCMAVYQDVWLWYVWPWHVWLWYVWLACIALACMAMVCVAVHQDGRLAGTGLGYCVLVETLRICSYAHINLTMLVVREF